MQQKEKKWFIRIIVILIVVGLGLFALNQTLGYIYKAQFLNSPCDLCRELNPEVDICLTEKVPAYDHSFNGNYSPEDIIIFPK